MSEDTKNDDTPVIEDPKAVLAALDKAKKEAKQFREERDSLQARLDSSSPDEAVSKWKDRAIKSEVRTALRSQGVSDPDRVLEFISLDGIDVDDEGSLVGLDESVKSVKAKLSELFDPKNRVKGSADLFSTGEPQSSKTSTEMQVERLFQRS